MAGMKKLLIIAKRSAYGLYVNRYNDEHIRRMLETKNLTVRNMLDRHVVHENAVHQCLKIFDRFKFQWTLRQREDLGEPISGFDLIVTIGGDGTILDTSHYVLNDIPVLGINSDPTQADEVEKNLLEFDARRSKGYLCYSTVQTLEETLECVLSSRVDPLSLTRMSTSINGTVSLPPALNDILISHPSPAAVSRLNFRIVQPGKRSPLSDLLHVRCSGLRICTATGSTAAMRSNDGYPMHILSPDLQYKVREPLDPRGGVKPLLHSFIEEGAAMTVTCANRSAKIFLDGCHVTQEILEGDEVTISGDARPLKLYLNVSK